MAAGGAFEQLLAAARTLPPFPRSSVLRRSGRRARALFVGRRDRLVDALRACGLRVEPPKASLYIWAHVPEGFTSAEFAARLIDEIDVVVTPGTGYGQYGEGYVRLSITTGDDRVEEEARRLIEWSKQLK